ncbi:MAG: AMP-binding protein [Christensenellales bacterium]
MYLELNKKDKNSIAAIDQSGASITYGEIISLSEQFSNWTDGRTLVFMLCANNIGTLAGYSASLCSRIVPLLLDMNLDRQMLGALIETYSPAYIWTPENIADSFEYKPQGGAYGYTLLKTGLDAPPLYNELSLLLTTSGSTGSPKLVRHSYLNLEANARNVAQFFELDANERPLIDLPMNYTYGLSVVNSHLYAGAKLLLTNATLTDKHFWDFLKEHKATSFTGVPYSYEILKKLRFFRMDLPYLKTLSQGGGKMTEELHREFAQFALDSGKRFIATFGQTEGTARMAYLPHEKALEKCGSIGGPIPNGELFLIDADGNIIDEPDTPGEMGFRGKNVTLGYALSADDLIKGDERNGVLHTGDIAYRDKDGYYYIVGRKSRFLKIYGFRVSLDECERLVKSKFDIECACSGSDNNIVFYITEPDIADDVREYALTKTKINPAALKVKVISEIPKNPAGKTIYSKLD